MDVTLEKLDDSGAEGATRSWVQAANLSGKRTETRKQNAPVRVFRRGRARVFSPNDRTAEPPAVRFLSGKGKGEERYGHEPVGRSGLLLYLLVGTGIIFTIRTRFIQVRKFGTGFKRLFGSINLNGEKAGKEGMSSFQAVATSIAAQVGTGNITGCATAMISGGPGAIFWMWVAAFFGMATIYGEACLAQKYKTTDETGHVIGGPVYYIRSARSWRASSPWPSSSPWASPATWSSPTPSATPSGRP